MSNHGIKYGLYFGLSAVGLYLLAYLVNSRMIFSPGFGTVVSFIIPIVCMVLAARMTRTAQEGFMSFGEALSATFLTYVIGSLIYTVFSYVMSNIIDPSLMETGKEVSLEAMDKLSGFLSEDQVDVMKDAIEEGTENAGFGAILLGWAVSLIFPGFIISAIISAIMKRNPVA